MQFFIEMSKYAGMREDLVQAGGGNSAYKMDDCHMAVKASGCQLADIKETSGYAIVNQQMIREAFLHSMDLDHMTDADSRRILEQAVVSCEWGRPSIETFLHAFSGRYSLHTHPVAVNILASRAGGMEVLQRLFPDAWIVPYATPGAALAAAYFKRLRQRGQGWEKESLVFLQNHGMLASAETADAVAAVTEASVRRIEDYLGIDMSGYHAVTELYHAVGHGVIWRVTDQNVKNARNVLGRVWEHAFCPDCVVFLGKRMYDAGYSFDLENYETFRSMYGEPVVTAYKEDLYIHAESVKKAMEIQSVLSFCAQVMQANAGQECRMLSDQEQDFLLGWDAEKYRRSME